MSIGPYLTLSYWQHALFSAEAAQRFLSAVGALFLAAEVFEFFKLLPQDKGGGRALAAMLIVSVLYVLFTRRPVRRVVYRVPKKDFCYEVRIANLLDSPENIVISTNTTFDTDIANGLIAPDSVQGQFTTRFFDGNTAELDRQIGESLKDVPSEAASSPGKKKRYPVGTVAKVKAHGKIFYLLAMAELNQHGTAKSSLLMIDHSLEQLWDYVAHQGELGSLAIPLLGTGRGRIELPRKKLVERIAQSFAYASREHIFADKLAIVVHPTDADKFSINLFEVRDYLSLSLHI